MYVIATGPVIGLFVLEIRGLTVNRCRLFSSGHAANAVTQLLRKLREFRYKEEFWFSGKKPSTTVRTKIDTKS